MKKFKSIIMAILLLRTANLVSAHEPNLHVSTRWKECSFQIDPSLTQNAWHQFAKEAGMVTYFRSVTDARPMGKGRFEVSVLQWNTKIDESDEAWNNTFVHPTSEHWLIGGSELPFPGLTIRAGVSKKIDVAAYWSERPGANYGVAGAQVQYNLINDTAKEWAVSTRASMNCLYGPADMNLYVVGVDVLTSKTFTLNSHFDISPYAGISSYGSHAHEKTDVVDLKDEYVSGMQGMFGAVAKIYIARLGVEYNFSNVNTLSYKLGVNFSF
jgi:hypothetical protein